MNRPQKTHLVYLFLSVALIVVYAITDHIVDRKGLYSSTDWHIMKIPHHFSIFFSAVSFTLWAKAIGSKWKSTFWLLGLVVLSGVYFCVFEFLMRVV